MSPEGPDRDVMIDFESATFVDSPDPQLLAAQAGYFGWAVATNRDWVDPEMARQWFTELVEYVGLGESPELWDRWRRALASRASRRERMSMGR